MGQDFWDRQNNLGGGVQAGAGCGQDGSSLSLEEPKILVFKSKTPLCICVSFNHSLTRVTVYFVLPYTQQNSFAQKML